jgi:hypothetical protein
MVRPVSVAKGRLPPALGLLNLHTNCPGCIRVGDLISLRNPETSPGTNLRDHTGQALAFVYYEGKRR